MTIYSNVKDTTMSQPASSPGLAFRKSCSACGQHKEIREWRGLSQEEIDRWTPEIHPVILAIEAALKERNA
jgi:hypothetical protein